MSIFFPSIATSFHASEGEKLVYKALQKLNNEYSIIHSYRWLGDESQRRSEGEADFLIIHPAKGILSVEVKAGGVAFRNGNWIQVNRNTGTEKVMDPFGQAAESQYRVRLLLRNNYRGTMPLIGRAVWFTSVCVDKNLKLPQEAVRDIILDQDSLAEPEKALDAAFGYWQRNLRFVPTPLTGGHYKELLRVLLPSFQIAETISSSARENQTSYVQLTRQQFAVLDFLREQKIAAIHGPAGTGKSLLAIEKARMLAQTGQKVLLLCFNEFLLQHLRTQELDPLITVHNVRSLAEEILQDDSLPIEQINKFFEEYFATDFDDTDWQYPNIVVDEGQDISDAMLEHLSFLAELNDGSFYVFYDRNQFILERNSPEAPRYLDTKAECRLVLFRNCRNTAEIAATVGSLVDMRQEPYVNNVHGEKPKAVFYNDKAAARGIAERFVKTMQENRVALEDMVILSVHSLEHSALHGVTELAGIPVSNTLEEGKVWVTTTRKYKGLEAKAVLLIDVEVSKLTDTVMQRMIYIGGSRANTYLKVAFYEDVEKGDYRAIVDVLQKQVAENCRDAQDDETGTVINLSGVTEVKLPGTRKSVVKLMKMETETQ
ncbi:MAG: NERD domain-containing protein [Acidaminococcaceae bacterium]|nr:NERD domain-containing protein [Acidaminococcaceae bacterium]